MSGPRVKVVAATPDRWPDVERLFGPKGAVDGCWCMWWRQSSAEYLECRGEPNRQAPPCTKTWTAVPFRLGYTSSRSFRPGP